MTISLPEPVRNFLNSNGQFVIQIDDLKGQSKNTVQKLTLRGEAPIILKKCKEEREINFYKFLSPRFNERGITVPELLYSKNRHVLIEYVEPIEKWTNDHLYAQMQYLNKLHSISDLEVPFKLKRFDWRKEDIKNLSDFFDTSTYSKIEDLIYHYQENASELFEGDSLISGDPNITNWGEKNGKIVLFDWERIGQGSPLLDLSIAIPGLPTEKKIEKYLFLYRNKSENVLSTSEHLREVNLIKTGIVWNIVSFLSSFYHQKSKPFD